LNDLLILETVVKFTLVIRLEFGLLLVFVVLLFFPLAYY